MNHKLSIVSLLFFISLISCSSNAQQTNVPVAEFDKAIHEKNIQLLDVRTGEEYKTGHLKNSLQANWNDEAEFKKRIASLDKNIPVYTYCLSGIRSAAATEWLNANGYKAFNMQGGINKWKAAGKELEQAAPVKQLTMQEYLQQIPSDKTVLVDFGAPWCPPCKKMDVVLKELQQTHGNTFTLVKIDGGINSNLVKELNVEEFPTFFIYKQGKQTWKAQGVLTASEIISQL